MKSPTPKVLFDVCGISSVAHVVRLARGLGASRVLAVVPPEHEAIRAELGSDVEYVPQDPPLGTGHAVRLAWERLGAFEGEVLVLYGDGPLYRGETLQRLLDHHAATRASQTLLSATFADPTGFGRVVTAADGQVLRIVEELDADAETRALREVNTGVLVLRAEDAGPALGKLGNANRKGEYYLTDLVEILRAAGRTVERVRLGDAAEAQAFNSIAELATVRGAMRARIAREHQDRGVDVVDPATTYIDVDVEIGAGTTIHPCTVITRGVRIGAGCVVGPFAHLQSGAVLQDGVEIGNFVEVKRSTLGPRAKAKHLTYLGDATVGAKANIGAGTITANYDGKAKHPTRIGDGAFLGSGTVIVAPSVVGAGAMTGAGAIVKRDSNIGPGEVWVGVPARRLDRGARAPNPTKGSRS